jgi:hypothetical protein
MNCATAQPFGHILLLMCLLALALSLSLISGTVIVRLRSA